MIDRAKLLTDLQTLLRKLEADLLERSDSFDVPEVGETLRSDYEQAKEAERTAQSYEEWRSDAITQMASAWVLSGVFVRFLEDNQLINPPVVAGSALTPSPSPQGEGNRTSNHLLLLGEKGAGGMRENRLQRARDEHELYFRQHPQDTDREYWLMVFDRLAKLPGAREIFGTNNRIRELPNWLSGDAAGELLRFFQRVEPETGRLVHDFTDEQWDTRFLGDLYQDLSEAARKKYALLQTPEFVESFILDRTLDPAIAEFTLTPSPSPQGEGNRTGSDHPLLPGEKGAGGMRVFRMIDPACGSGHFLLGSFHRLLDRWLRKEPGTNVRELVQRSLNSIHGVDINPYAVAIARFRLLLAAMQASGIRQLRDAPAFRIQVVCGDSLLHGEGTQLAIKGLLPKNHYYKSEDITELNRVLIRGHYHAVVANPPYITPKDSAANEVYRKLYKETCYRQYSLAVPFMQRIYSLAVQGGFTGQITANSFMKREFGKKLIESFIPNIDLTHVIDTSLAYIPGHGTPTVILLGRNRRPISSTLRAVMGIKRENHQPNDPAKGMFWTAILNQIDFPGSRNEFISVVDSTRTLFHKHPWSIGGGGVTDLKGFIEAGNIIKLDDVIETICSICLTRADEVYIMPSGVLPRKGIKREHQMTMVLGEQIRDWGIYEPEYVLFPYTSDLKPVSEYEGLEVHHFLWRFKEILWRRRELGGDHRELNRTWWEWNRFLSHRFKVPMSIAFASVATHNHFVLECGNKMFKQSSPVIKMPAGTTKDEQLALISLLNSSIACFWMRQVCHDKGGGGIGGGVAAETWERFFDFDATKLKSLPIPKNASLAIAKQLDVDAQCWSQLLPFSVLSNQTSSVTSDLLQRKKQFAEQVRNDMILLQEELDWQCYQLYGLIDENLTHPKPPPIVLGQRAFEIVMARKMAAGELQTTWFDRHNSTPITELPSEWSDDYKQLVQRRIEVIERDRNIALIEQPEYKRRWNTETWDSQLERALRGWLCDRLETYFDFDGRMNDESKPTNKIDISLISIAQITDLARQDPEFLQVGELYRKDSAFDVQKLVAELVEAESVPLLPILRYKPSGLRKRAEWEHTWKLQRLEDAIDVRTKLPKDHPDYVPEFSFKAVKQQEIGDIPVPPKYTSSDFQKSHYWRLRGKLDVPKERWVSFPYCNAEDGTVTIAWAGYNHLQLAQAISTYFVHVKEDIGGRDDPRLLPLLASLIELLPWLKQWHNDLDPTYNLAMGDYFEAFIQDEAREMGKTLDEMRSWQPPAKTNRRRLG